MLADVTIALFYWYYCFVFNVAEFLKLYCGEQLLVFMIIIFVIHSLVPVLDLIKRSYHGWLSMMASSKGPPVQPCLGPPTSSSPLVNCDILGVLKSRLGGAPTAQHRPC